LLQSGNRCARPTLIGGRRLKALYVRMPGQQIGDGAAKRSLAVTMDNADALNSSHIGGIQELVDSVRCFIDRRADHVDLRIEVLIDADRGAHSAWQAGGALR